MDYNENDLNYFRFLLMRIGFTNNNKIEKIRLTYQNRFGIIETSESSKGLRNRKGQIYKYLKVIRKKVNYQQCIENLKFEIDFRFKIGDLKYKLKQTELISATEINSFFFCKASYSISSTFIIEESINKLSKYYGTKLHENLRLKFKKEYFGFRDEYNEHFSDYQKSVLDRINKCESIFLGHEKEHFTFQNFEKGFIGQPDYIFKDPNGNYFVIEEKFHARYSSNKISETDQSRNAEFYENNLAQLQSYIQYITDYDLKYGILFNWYYIIENEKIIVDDFTFKVIYKNQNIEVLEKVFDDIKEFKKTKRTSFNNDVNINKCLNCSVSFYCGHKTDEFDFVEFPYSKEFLKLKYLDYPF